MEVLHIGAAACRNLQSNSMQSSFPHRRRQSVFCFSYCWVVSSKTRKFTDFLNQERKFTRTQHFWNNFCGIHSPIGVTKFFICEVRKNRCQHSQFSAVSDQVKFFYHLTVCTSDFTETLTIQCIIFFLCHRSDFEGNHFSFFVFETIRDKYFLFFMYRDGVQKCK
nr:MAG TPA: hypothetical protein [Caudoviricetes sp.]